MVAWSAPPHARPIRQGWRIVATALAAVIVGVLLSVRALTPAPASHQARSYRISDDVPTSFGIVAVEFVRSVDGVSHRALAGANHGVQGYVDEGQQQIQVAIAITNRGKGALAYTVRQFQLKASVKGKTTVLSATAGDLPDGRILPDAGIEGHLDFTLPAADATMSLLFRDPGAKAPVTIDLGTIAATTPGPVHSHG